MKIEIGKYYASRDGIKYKCVHDFGHGESQFVMIADHGGITYVGRFKTNGTVTGYSNYGHCLVSELVEPVEHEVELWFYRGIGKAIVPTKYYDEGLDVIAKVKVKFKEGDNL